MKHLPKCLNSSKDFGQFLQLLVFLSEPMQICCRTLKKLFSQFRAFEDTRRRFVGTLIVLNY